MEIEARRDDRGYALIANFVDGFALGWKMAVPEGFKEALDIKLTPRIFAKKKEMLWTQGRLYDFHEGDTFHDTVQAYGEWKEALKHLKISVQIQFTSSSGYVVYESIEVKNEKLEIIHQGDVKHLTNFTPEYSLRVSGYRILFKIENNQIKIYRIMHRKEVCK